MPWGVSGSLWRLQVNQAAIPITCKFTLQAGTALPTCSGQGRLALSFCGKRQERKHGLGRELGLLEGTASSLHCATRSAHRMAARAMQAAADAAQASAASGKCRAASPLTKGISRVTARQSNFWPIWRRRGGARSSRWSVCQQRGAGRTRSRIRLACIQLQQEEANPFCAVQSCSSPSCPSCRGQARLTCLLQSDRLAVLGAATG